jgi:hypothetical protein
LIDALEGKSAEQDTNMFKVGTELETLKMNFQLQSRTMMSLKNTVKEGRLCNTNEIKYRRKKKLFKRLSKNFKTNSVFWAIMGTVKMVAI